MSEIASLTEAFVRLSGSPEGAAERLGVSAATIARWRTGRTKPHPEQERKLRRLVEIVDEKQRTLPLTPPAYHDDNLEKQIENVIRSILDEFRETLHRYGRFSHRNDSLDFLAKVLFAHFTDKGEGNAGLHLGMTVDAPARRLREFVERRLKSMLPNELGNELIQMSKTLAITDRDDDLARQVIQIFDQQIVNDVLAAIIGSHRFDVMNSIFGRFVTDSFVEEKELAQYLTPPDVVRLMASIGAASLSRQLCGDLASESGTRIILDPSCGVGSFLVEGVHAVKQRAVSLGYNKLSELNERVVGIDKSERMVQLTVTNLALLGTKRATVFLDNALDRRTANFSRQLQGQAGLILTNPPFGASFSAAEIGAYELFNFSDRKTARIDSELLFLERYVEWLCPGGILVAIVPDSVLTNQGLFQKARRHLAGSCDLISVISLPQVTFAAAGTTTKTSILHMRKRATKAKDNSTYFASCEHVGYEVVTRGAQRRKVINERNQLPAIAIEARGGEAQIGKRMGFDAAASDRWDAKFNQGTHHDDAADTTIVRVGDIADLVSEKFDPRRMKADEFDYIEISDIDERSGLVYSKRIAIDAAPSRARKRVRSGDVLMSTVRPERGSVGVVPPHLDGAICSTGFAVFRSKGINPYLLAFLLKSRRLILQVERHMSGIAYPAINEGILPDLGVMLPTLEDGAVSAYQNAVETMMSQRDKMVAAMQ
jgi:type I restriction-modification system DNA methylase subunit